VSWAPPPEAARVSAEFLPVLQALLSFRGRDFSLREGGDKRVRGWEFANGTFSPLPLGGGTTLGEKRRSLLPA